MLFALKADHYPPGQQRNLSALPNYLGIMEIM